MKPYIVLIISIFWINSGAQDASQSTYGLQECISIALDNNLDLKLAELRKETADVNFRISKNDLLPNINGNYNIGKTSGRSIDPFTNSYINEQLTFSNAGLRLDAIVFDGFRLINTWKQQKLNLQAAEMAEEEARQTLVLDVTLAYLQVVNLLDLVTLAENRLEGTKTQLERLRTLFDQEMGNPSEFRDLQGLLANDEANLVLTKNNLRDAKLALMQLLNTQEEFKVARIDVPTNIAQYSLSAEEIYRLSLQNFATVKASELRLQAAEKGVSVAKSQYVPQVSIFGNLNTNYSSAARFFNEGETSILESTDFVTVDGQDFPVFKEQTNFLPEEISYSDQFENNLNTAAGVAVNIPLFNGFRAKNNVELEKIRKEEASVDLERTKIGLKTAIEQAYADMEGAFERYEILQQQVEAYKESFRVNEIRFNNGVTNSVDYIISKNNFDNAEISLNTVKYEIVLRVKVLEYYQGNI